MEFGASIFFTDYSITPADLAVALEQRGFDSLWAAEHSHIPVPRRTPPPGGGELAKRYYDVMDPFVTLTAAAAATKTLKVGTGVCLVIQRDTIQTAKLVASIDQVSGGRFLFGIGGGWNAEEIEAHGTVFATRMKKMREQIVRHGLAARVGGVAAIKADLPRFMRAFTDTAEYALVREDFVRQVQPLLERGCDVLIQAGGLPMLLFAQQQPFVIEGAVVLEGIATVIKATEMALALHGLTGVAASRRGLYSRAPEGAIADFLAGTSVR